MDDKKLYGKNERQLGTLINLVRIFNRDICMEFRLSRSAVLVMKKYIRSDGIILLDQQQIHEVDVDKGYRYLGVLEGDGIKDKLMKEAIMKGYIRQVRKNLKSKLYGVNTITAINIRVDIKMGGRQESYTNSVSCISPTRRY